MIIKKKITIECRSLNSILEQNKFQNFEYLNIDVEGSEEKVIEGIDLIKFRPILITIENNNLHIKDYMNSKTYNILVKYDYIFIGKTGVTNFFLINQHAKNFSNLIKI